VAVNIAGNNQITGLRQNYQINLAIFILLIRKDSLFKQFDKLFCHY
jgi:hypothetical protein